MIMLCVEFSSIEIAVLFRDWTSRNGHGSSEGFLLMQATGFDRLEALHAASDFVTIAAPHTLETAGLFNARTFAKMKLSSYLINVRRDTIEMLDDLIEALQAGRLGGAALDVLAVEPLPREHPL